MAGLWLCYLRVYAPADDVLNQPLNIVGSESPGIIQRGMVSQLTVPGGIKDLYGVNVDSDLGGYKKIVPVNQAPTALFSGYVGATRFPGTWWADVEEFATDGGTMGGLIANGNATFSYRSYWAKENTLLIPDQVRIYGYMYHRTAGGTETLLDTCASAVTQSETHYTDTMTANNRAFGTNERFVVKWRAKFEKGV